MPFNSYWFPLYDDQKNSFPKVYSPKAIYFLVKETSKVGVLNYPDFLKISRYPKISIDERQKREFLMNIIKNSAEANLSCKTEKGIAESIFQQLLTKYFEDKILWDRGIACSEFIINPYIPDFIFSDPTSGLKIDIEIDEPYILGSGEPIHFDYVKKQREGFINIDADRNAFFKNMGWFIVRFTEEQIITQGKDCCLFLAQMINEITGNSSYLKSLEYYDDLYPTLLWPLERCLDLEKKSYRESYLGLPKRKTIYIPTKEILDLLIVEKADIKKEPYNDDDLIDFPF